MVEYPYFVDIRTNGMNQKTGMVSGIDQVTLNWASPITIDSDKNKDRKVVRLLHSSAQAWTSDMTDIQPDFRSHGSLGFSVGDETGSKLLAVMVEGRFSSYFKDKPFRGRKKGRKKILPNRRQGKE
jgi:ABC-2 type transport system permease protein